MIHGLELLIQAQDLMKAYQTSTCFRDIYHYITDGKLPSGTKAQNCIHAEAFNYVVVNNFLFRIDTQKDKDCNVLLPVFLAVHIVDSIALRGVGECCERCPWNHPGSYVLSQ